MNSLLDASLREHREGQRQRCPLTPREREVLSLVAQGFSDKEIAFRLPRLESGRRDPEHPERLSAYTVYRHVANCRYKLDADSRFKAVAMAREAGWIGDEQDG